jgi:general secretion pathway protein J
VFVENEPSSVQVVAYRLVNGVLTRRESLGTRDLSQLDIVWMAMISDTDSNAAVPLQSGVNSMQVMTWENNGWKLSGQGDSSSQQQAPQPQQPIPQQLQPAINQVQRGPTGLQVALQAHGMAAPMVKSFLLGGL